MQNISSIYRLGLDLGTSSIGWALLKFNIINDEQIYDSIIASGSRIFSDGRTASKTGGLGDSLASARREARQARKQQDRKVGRRIALFKQLQNIGLMPLDESISQKLKDKNPYELRSKATFEKLELFEIGRAIFHLQQRRGFKSSRKDKQKINNPDNDVKSPVKGSIKKIEQQLQQQNFQTVGQLLWQKFKDPHDTPLCKKKVKVNAKGEEIGIEGYENYFDRQMIINEFNIIWDTQAKFYTNTAQSNIFNQDNKHKVRTVIFFQRPLKDALVGKCTYIPTQARANIALPSSEMYRIWQDINNLKLQHGKQQIDLSLEQKQILIEKLLTQKDLSFTKSLEILFDKKQAKEYKFNFESAKSDKLSGANTYSQLIEIVTNIKDYSIQQIDLIVSLVLQDKSALSIEKQEYIKHHRLDNEQIEDIFSKYIQEVFGFNDDIIAKLNAMTLKDDYGSLSTQAMLAMLEHMQKGMSQYEAKVLCGFKDNIYIDNALAELPYYGKVIGQYCIPQKHLFEYAEKKQKSQNKLHQNTLDEIYLGKITNPSVHICLNELRKIVNLIIKKYKKILNNSKPDYIHIEMARDLCMGQKSLDKLIRKQNENEKNNQKLKETLKSIGIIPTSFNMLKLELYNRLKTNANCCIYTGTPLPSHPKQIFEDDEWQIDHILPISRSFNDNKNNKILISRQANQLKKERTPWEYVSQDMSEQEKEAYLERIQAFPKQEEKSGQIVSKGIQWLFLEQGTEYLKHNPLAKKQERLLNDTRYMTRVARMYLQSLYNKYDENRKEQRDSKVVAIPSGSITANVRRQWKLDSLLWTTEQQEIQKDIKARIQALKDKQNISSLSDDEVKECSMLMDLEHLPLDNLNYTYFNELIKQSEISEKQESEALEKIEKAKQKLKNRNDHRHHAIDAVVIALTDTKVVQQSSRNNKSKKDTSVAIPSMLKQHLENKVKQIVVSHKPDHATEGQLHKETAMNIIARNKDKCDVIANKQITKNVSIEGLVGIKDKKGNPFKYYATEGNYCYEIFQNEQGKIDSQIISKFKANQKAFQKFKSNSKIFNQYAFDENGNTSKKLLMRIIKKDLLKINDSGKERIVYIQKITKGKITLCEHFEANCNARSDIKGNAFIMRDKSPNKLLAECKAKKILITPIGQIRVIQK